MNQVPIQRLNAISWAEFFESAAPYYSPFHRYSRTCMTSCIHLLVSMIQKSKPSILDVGTGTGVPAAMLGRQIPLAKLHLLDLSMGMLKEARSSWPKTMDLPVLLRGNALELPLKDGLFDAILSSCMIVLIPDRPAFFREIGRVLKSGGILMIVTYDPDDLDSQVFDRYFPNYLALNRRRHPPIRKILRELGDASFKTICIRKFPYRFSFRTRSQLLSFVSSKPFSTFAEYDEKEFKEGFSQFRDRIENELPERNIVNRCKLTCIIAVWQGSLEGRK